jgi:hypothetical protein
MKEAAMSSSRPLIRLVGDGDVFLVPDTMPAKSVHAEAWTRRKEVLYTSGPMCTGFILPGEYCEVECDPNDENTKRIMQFVPEVMPENIQ